MTDWLRRELEKIRTRRFHVVEPLAGEDRAALGDELPPSYRAFLEDHGTARLYALGRGAYALGVRTPEPAAKGDEPLLAIGHHDDARAYLKVPELAPGAEAPVHEWGAAGLRRAAPDFATWLDGRAARIRKKLGRARWRQIVEGPAPFTAEERAIVEARRLFRWRVRGITKDGAHLIEVENRSDRTLPFLSIGVRGKKLVGGIWLPVHDVAPGARVVIEKQCYRGLVPPAELELHALPDPEPEDRADYWELKAADVRARKKRSPKKRR